MNKRIISMLMISALIISASGCDSIYVEEATTTTAENFPATTAGVTDSTTGTEAPLPQRKKLSFSQWSHRLNFPTEAEFMPKASM